MNHAQVYNNARISPRLSSVLEKDILVEVIKCKLDIALMKSLDFRDNRSFSSHTLYYDDVDGTIKFEIKDIRGVVMKGAAYATYLPVDKERKIDVMYVVIESSFIKVGIENIMSKYNPYQLIDYYGGMIPAEFYGILKNGDGLRALVEFASPFDLAVWIEKDPKNRQQVSKEEVGNLTEGLSPSFCSVGSLGIRYYEVE